MNVYIVTVDGVERMRFQANLAQASAPILLEGDATPFQTADARHDEWRAAELLNAWCRSEGGAAWGDDEEIDIVALDD